NTGAGDLTFSITQYDSTIGSPPFITSPADSIIAVNSSVSVDIQFVASQLISGDNHTNIEVTSDDPIQPTTIIPMVITYNGSLCAFFEFDSTDICGNDIDFSDLSIGSPN
ncbi:MAG: hypothetical protein IH948_09470, partial [Bacteroidetes bacterium]|nr:hypothetical protein [Bacteroidota bacterium]